MHKNLNIKGQNLNYIYDQVQFKFVFVKGDIYGKSNNKQNAKA